MRHIASCSFGKDSLAMVLKLIEKGEPLDEVVFYDTGKEFNAIYALRDKVRKLLLEKGIKFTQLQPKCSFDYYMFDHVKRNGEKGYGWCGGIVRWGTQYKISSLDRVVESEDKHYIGIAVDEPARLAKDRKPNKVFPLAGWGMTEKHCLEYCYDRNMTWLEKTDSIYDVPEYVDLYAILDRVSCWCCRNKNLKELKAIYYYFTNSYWKGLKDIQARLIAPMKQSGSVFDLEKRFKREIEVEGKLP